MKTTAKSGTMKEKAEQEKQRNLLQTAESGIMKEKAEQEKQRNLLQQIAESKLSRRDGEIAVGEY